MSLYYEAASILQNADNVGGSLTSRIYGKKGLKSKPTAIYALVTESTKWSAVLKDVVENSGILKLEKKLTPLLAVLLTHDLLISKGGVAAPAQHPLKLAITRHKARLSAEFTKIRVKRGFGTLDAFRQAINGSAAPDGTSTSARGPEHPRWVRVNAVRTTLAAQLRTTFAGYERKDSLSDVMAAAASAKVLHVDAHIPNLLALPPRADLSKVAAYRSGELIIQDKASCFPAYLLDVQPSDGDAIDGCAAPGNKTTHLAAIIAARQHQAKKTGDELPQQRIIACERDKRRSLILAKMVRLAGADHLVTVHPSQDFLDLDPTSPSLSRVGAILLDPSCSGSGIVSRDDDVKLELPSAGPSPSTPQGKKRKRGGKHEPPTTAQDDATTTVTLTEHDASDTTTPLPTRLAALSSFQLRLLTRAMSFPAARRIAYSTCSVHAAENEGVVAAALGSRVALARGWRLLRREEQVAGMRAWGVRGEAGAWGEGVREACVRCEKGTAEGTMGFFVAGFVREGGDGGEWGGGGVEEGEGEGEEEWNGFSDDD
ncbi:putative methyltransferase [Neofusicoccum parvum]|uniref:Methyltransferase n=1 Tax=Neofusicoccum parvum TaxID=310453 RepID=A0ACB5S7J2_9PEZI|nr:putative methyltransferase [Neofusicoccum parvum]